MKTKYILPAFLIFLVLVPPALAVNDFKRHIELDTAATSSAEASGAATDVLGPAGYASGDGVVDFFYCDKDKGPVIASGREYKWHEELRLTNANIRVERDAKDAGDGNLYDEIYMQTLSNTIAYRLSFSPPIPLTSLPGKTIYFFGKEYTVQSAATDKVKIAASETVFVLDTTNANTAVIGDVEVILEGVYSTGTGNIYKTKITVKNGYDIESKFIEAGSLDIIAGVEVYVREAVTTVAKTSHGEAKIAAGVNILSLEDGAYLQTNAGTDSTWQVSVVSSGANLDYIEATETLQHSTIGGTNSVLYPGDFMQAPTGGVQIVYDGITTGLGASASYSANDLDITPDSRDLDADGIADACIRARTPGGEFMTFLQAGVQKRSNEVWMNSGDNQFYYHDGSAHRVVTTPAVSIGSDSAGITWAAAGGGTGTLTITEPTLRVAGVAGTMTIEYSGATSTFVDITGDGIYVNDGLAGLWIAKTTATRDYYTRYGTFVDSVGTTVVSMKLPQQQVFGLYSLNKIEEAVEQAEVQPGTAEVEILEEVGTSAEEGLEAVAEDEWAQDLVESWEEAQETKDVVKESESGELETGAPGLRGAEEEPTAKSEEPKVEEKDSEIEKSSLLKRFFLAIWKFIW